MAGIQLEQLDLASLERYFATKAGVANATTKDSIMKTIAPFSEIDFDETGINERLNRFLNKSNQIESREGASIRVVESDGVEYDFSPSKGYVKKDDEDILVYEHPLTHNAVEIDETTDRQFASAAEKNLWTNKVDKASLNDAIDQSKTEVITLLLSYIDSLTTRLATLENELDINTTENTRKEIINMINNALDNVCKKFTILGYSTLKEYVIEHNLNTKDLQIAVIDNDTMQFVYPTITVDTYNSFKVNFKQNIDFNSTYSVIVTAKSEIKTIYNEINNSISSLCIKYTLAGDGDNTDFIINHNKGTKDLYVTCIEERTGLVCVPSVTINNDNRITIGFSKAPLKGDVYYVYVSSAPEITNENNDKVIDSLINEDKVQGIYNVNDVYDTVVSAYDLTYNVGETVKTITHNKNTFYPNIALFDKATGEYTIFPEYTIVDENTIRIRIKARSVITNYRVILVTNERVSYKAIESTDIPVASVKLNKSSITLYGTGETDRLIHTVLPANASNTEVVWESSDTDIAEVVSGVVTSVGLGSCIISVRTVDGNFIASAAVTVAEPIIAMETVTLNKNTLNFTNVNLTQKLSATIYPDDCTYPDVVWSSSNNNIASVDQDGNVTSNGVGDCVITVKSAKDDSVYDECTVNVEIITVVTTELQISPSSVVFNNIGETKEITYAVKPWDATDKTVSYISDNPEIASVSTDGVITAEDVGSTTITVRTNDASHLTKTISVTVKKPVVRVTGVTTNKSEIELAGANATDTVTAVITPLDADDKLITWTIQNPEIAVISGTENLSCTVRGIKKGSTILTGTTSDGEFKATVIVTVN